MKCLLLCSASALLFVGCTVDQAADFQADLDTFQGKVNVLAGQVESLQVAAQPFLPPEANGALAGVVGLLTTLGAVKVTLDKRKKKAAS